MISVSALLKAFGIAGVGALGCVSSSAGAVLFLAWLAVWALPAGYLARRLGLRPWPVGLAVPGVWMILLASLDSGSRMPLPDPLYGTIAFSGLYVVGLGLGGLLPAPPWTGAGILLVLAAGAAAVPGAFGWRDGAWGPGVTARALDLSPVAFVTESAGVDWMRHPAQYEPAGTSRLGPDLRVPWEGSLAAPVLLLVGCVLAAAGSRRQRVHCSASRDGREPED